MMIAYVDSSVLTCAYLPDEELHPATVELLQNSEIALITGTWTMIEVTGTLVRAERSGRVPKAPLALLDADLSADGSVSLVQADQDEVEHYAVGLAREHGIRAMDAWHLAVASIAIPLYAEPGEEIAFASRDKKQSKVAESLGFKLI